MSSSRGDKEEACRYFIRVSDALKEPRLEGQSSSHHASSPTLRANALRRARRQFSTLARHTRSHGPVTQESESLHLHSRHFLQRAHSRNHKQSSRSYHFPCLPGTNPSPTSISLVISPWMTMHNASKHQQHKRVMIKPVPEPFRAPVVETSPSHNHTHKTPS